MKVEDIGIKIYELVHDRTPTGTIIETLMKDTSVVCDSVQIREMESLISRYKDSHKDLENVAIKIHKLIDMSDLPDSLDFDFGMTLKKAVAELVKVRKINHTGRVQTNKPNKSNIPKFTILSEMTPGVHPTCQNYNRLRRPRIIREIKRFRVSLDHE